MGNLGRSGEKNGDAEGGVGVGVDGAEEGGFDEVVSGRSGVSEVRETVAGRLRGVLSDFALKSDVSSRARRGVCSLSGNLRANADAISAGEEVGRFGKAVLIALLGGCIGG